MMIPIENPTTTPTPTEKSEVRDIFSEISPFEGFEQRNQNECKFQNIYEAQKPIDFSSHQSIQSGPSLMSQKKPTGSLPQGLGAYLGAAFYFY